MKCRPIIIIRATQKKMMSKPVTAPRSCSSVSSSIVPVGQPSVENGQSAEENQVSRTSGSRRRSTCRRSAARASASASSCGDKDRAVRHHTRPGSGGPTRAGAKCTRAGCSPSSRNRSVPVLGHELGLALAHRSNRGLASVSASTNHWSVSIGSITTPERSPKGCMIFLFSTKGMSAPCLLLRRSGHHRSPSPVICAITRFARLKTVEPAQTRLAPG
jgi:hypothetical protein